MDIITNCPHLVEYIYDNYSRVKRITIIEVVYFFEGNFHKGELDLIDLINK